jgi:hypothetical protein
MTIRGVSISRFTSVVITGIALTMVAAPLAMAAPSSTSMKTDLSTSRAFFDDDVCNHSDSPELCMSSNGVSGDLVYGKTWSSGSNQELMDVLSTTDCGSGVVTSSCPFTSTTLDGLYNGDQIVTLSNYNYGTFFAGQTNETVKQVTGGNGVDWVTAGCFQGGCTPAQLINPYVTNQTDNDSHFVCTNGSNGALDLQQNYNNTCNWQKGN